MPLFLAPNWHQDLPFVVPFRCRSGRGGSNALVPNGAKSRKILLPSPPHE
jgi:hypothetical protein